MTMMEITDSMMEISRRNRSCQIAAVLITHKIPFHRIDHRSDDFQDYPRVIDPINVDFENCPAASIIPPFSEGNVEPRSGPHEGAVSRSGPAWLRVACGDAARCREISQSSII